MPAHEAWLAFWQRERSGATRAGVLAGACSDCGSALRYAAGPRVARTLAVVALRLDAHCEQRLPATGSRARHGQPAESTAGKEALCASSGTGGEPTANGRVAQVTVPALPIFKTASADSDLHGSLTGVCSDRGRLGAQATSATRRTAARPGI